MSRRHVSLALRALAPALLALLALSPLACSDDGGGDGTASTGTTGDTTGGSAGTGASASTTGSTTSTSTAGSTSGDSSAATTSSAGTTVDSTTDGTTGGTTGDATTSTGTTGDATTGATTGIDFPDGAIFVHADDGMDSNPGTQEAPLRTIQAGIKAAAELPDGEVFVAAGTYEAHYQMGVAVTLAPGVSLHGGFAADDWQVRDPAIHVSHIVDASAVGGTELEPNRALDAGAGVGPDTVVDGFTIRSGAGAWAAAVVLKDASPTLAGNRIEAGKGATSVSGVNTRGGSPVLRDNVIVATSGGAALYTYGVLAEYGGDLTIDRNTLHGGDGKNMSTAIHVSDADATITSNVIDAGDSALEIRGISASTTKVVIAGNTVVAGQATYSTGVMVTGVASPSIDDNLIVGAKVCVFEGPNGTKAVSVRANDFYCAPTLYHVGPSDKFYSEIAPAEADLKSQGASASGNVKAPPAFVDEAKGDYHLSSGEVLCMISLGGVELPGVLTTDRDGAARSKPVSIGAYEHNGACF